MTDSLRAADLPLGRVTQLDDYAVGNNGDYFAVSRRCRRLGANLAAGRISLDGCLVCPWHEAEYLGTAFQGLTRVLPLRRRLSPRSVTICA